MVEIIEWDYWHGEYYANLPSATLLISHYKGLFVTRYVPFIASDIELGSYLTLETAKMAAEIWYINRSKG